MPHDTCSATHRDKGRLHICERPFGHSEDHGDDDYAWTDGPSLDARTVYDHGPRQ